MIDLHTHILPGIDDGAKNSRTSIEMLCREVEQGVDTVVLTPHFYRDRESPEHFLARRRVSCAHLKQRLLELPEEERSPLPRMLVGAEVAWVPNMTEWPELPELCISGTQYLLLELPFHTWNDTMFYQIYDLMSMRGITPVIAHLERYMKIESVSHIDNIISMGVPVQISADTLLHPLHRRQVLRMLRKGEAQIVASDCHNLTNRPPNLAAAMQVVERKLGNDLAASIEQAARRIVFARSSEGNYDDK